MPGRSSHHQGNSTWSSLDEEDESMLQDEPWDTSLDEDRETEKPALTSKRSRQQSPSTKGSPEVFRHRRRRGLHRRTLRLSDDADTERMIHRKRALAYGNFKFLYRSEGGGVALDDTKAFSNALRAFEGTDVRYVKVPPGYIVSHYPKTRYAKFKIKKNFPGFGNRFNVAWTLPNGEIVMDYSVKLYDFDAIYSVEIEFESKSPKSPWFGLIDPRIIPTSDEKVNFDANVFWTVAFLFKHFGTCGIESWDKEIMDLKWDFGESLHDVSLTESLQQSDTPPAKSPSEVQGGGMLYPLVSRSEERAYLTDHVVSPITTEEYNPLLLDWSTRYTGCVTEWRGSFGFLACTHINGRIFLHASDIDWSPECKERFLDLPIGASVNFQLTLDPQNRYKAAGARLFL